MLSSTKDSILSLSFFVNTIYHDTFFGVWFPTISPEARSLLYTRVSLLYKSLSLYIHIYITCTLRSRNNGWVVRLPAEALTYICLFRGNSHCQLIVQTIRRIHESSHSINAAGRIRKVVPIRLKSVNLVVPDSPTRTYRCVPTTYSLTDSFDESVYTTCTAVPVLRIHSMFSHTVTATTPVEVYINKRVAVI